MSHLRDSEEKPKVLFVGLVCIDIVNICPKYPDEDTDTLVIHQEWRRGGNASNNSTVLSLLGQPCAFFGSMASSYEKAFLIEDFAKYNIDISSCIFHDGHINIQTVVLINSLNASRTILSPPINLPSVTFEEFLRIDLHKNAFKWIHFEALSGTENIRQLKKILQYLSDTNRSKNLKERIITSVEVEKPEKEFEILLCEPNYVFLGKDYAKFRGYSSMEEAVTGLAISCPQSEALICTWGEQGATCRLSNGAIYHSPAEKLTNPEDSLGAGDTFTAGTIYSLLQGLSVEDAITFGCRLATRKCSMNGFDGLKNFT
ncbi:ketohexokinase isoform X2 [Octopus sinensis]|uniref:Ketohexokinase isoform X2 n=1 Tax=Octopus sinensis TaxID=2607531 RepID=A0A6P7TYQ5_9MOLL|nr:ketohexokinase isoform X2 [Octopus sinensis]XP_036354397.1 ketohexokinase isoform X2 [Octopus sinensis]XP_036354398.1 ketohexokinase isoform X2 [Octopus sinensis]XP_036354399.1 ketohexokinase isoform X2 [Octopus sinensis]XP_036354400.1 ketohexokinase isoform X2 [Octopus sinensis]